MTDEKKTKAQLVAELKDLRRQASAQNERRVKGDEIIQSLTEETLRRSEERLRFHLENSPMAVIEWDAKFIVTRWTGEAEKIFGWSAKEVIGKPIMDLNMVFEEDISIVKKTLKRLARKTSKHVVSNNRNYTKDRRVIYCEWHNSILLDRRGNVISVLSQALDVTKRKQAEEEYQTVVKTAMDGFLVMNMEGRFLDANEAYCQLLGYSREELLEMSVQDVETTRKSEDIARHIQKIIKTGYSRFESKHRRKDGGLIDFEINANFTPIYGGQFYAFLRDISARKQTEKDIYLMAKLPAESPNPILRADANGVLLYVNPAGTNLLPRWKLQTGKPLPPLLQEAVLQSMYAKTNQTLDLTHDKRVFSFFIAPIIEAGYANLYGRDITESRQAKALREAEARYRLLFEQSPYGVLLINPNTGKAIEANAVASQQLGYAPEEFSEIKISDYEVIETPEVIIQRAKKIIREGSDDFETLHRAKNGEIKNVHVWVKTLPINKQILFYCIYQDVTERKRTEKTLRESEARFSTIFHSSPARVAITRFEDGLFLDANEVFLNSTGYTREEIIGHAARELDNWVNPDDGVKLRRMLTEKGRARNFETQLRRKNEPPVDVLMSADIVELFGERCILSVGVDITERKEAERLQQEMSILREIDRLRSEFVGNVSHELRTPLGLILLMATALRKTELRINEEKTRGFLRDIEIETRKLQGVVTDLLDISSIQNGNLVLKMRRGDLRRTLKRAVKMFALQQNGSHALNLQLPAYVLEARLDSNRIEQVLQNLLGNASKFSPVGTAISVEAKIEEKEIRVTVSDEGPGVPDSERENIFGRFYRIENKNTAYVPGLGLGLSISRSIAREHGGNLRVENRPQGGSIFIFTLPTKNDGSSVNSVS